MPKLRLVEVLKERTEGEKLCHKLEEIKGKVKYFLDEIPKTFPEYTKHDIEHSERVIDYLDLIIPDSLKKELDTYEIFFLLASAYLHDIGMIRFPEDEDTDSELIREMHHLRSEKFIVENYKDLSIEDEHQARIIGKICRGHRKEDLRSFRIETYKIGHTINVPLLAALLRIADELDITFERAPFVIYEHIPPKDQISKEEWESIYQLVVLINTPKTR